MKKAMGIIVLGLLWCNAGLSNSIFKYEKVGFKLKKSLLEIITIDDINEELVPITPHGEISDKFVGVFYIPNPFIYPED